MFSNLKKQHNSLERKINNALEKIIKGGVFVGGKAVENFEKRFAYFCKVKYAISVNSGTDALFLSLKALGIGSGDEVITTPFTFIATAEAIAGCGARPVFVDINPNDFNIDVSRIEKSITQKTKAIMPVHLFGQMADMDEIIKIAKKYKLLIIEDACQAVGAGNKRAGLPRRSVARAGTIGNAGCFSFFPSKNLGAMGDGGMIVTDNKKLAEKIKILKNHGSSKKDKYKNLVLGTNSRLDAIQAAVLNIKLNYVRKWNERRAHKAKYYSEKLGLIKEIKTPRASKETVHIFHQYTIRAQKRDLLKKFLEKNGIETMVYYPIPLHLQPALKYLNYKRGDFPEAEKAAKEVLSLSIYPELETKEQNYIIEKIKRFYQK